MREPGYWGPQLAALEKVAAEIAEVRLAARDWAITAALRRPPRSASRAVVRQALGEALRR